MLAHLTTIGSHSNTCTHRARSMKRSWRRRDQNKYECHRWGACLKRNSMKKNERGWMSGDEADRGCVTIYRKNDNSHSKVLLEHCHCYKSMWAGRGGYGKHLSQWQRETQQSYLQAEWGSLSWSSRAYHCCCSWASANAEQSKRFEWRKKTTKWAKSAVCPQRKEDTSRFKVHDFKNKTVSFPHKSVVL